MRRLPGWTPAIITCTFLAVACAEPPAPVADDVAAPPGPAAPAPDIPWAFAVDTIARDLVVPWGLALAPDGRLFVTERPGRIVTVAPDGRVTPFAELDVHGEAAGIGPESGLLGIALAPDFTTTGHVFVVATTWRTAGDRASSRATRLWRAIAGRVSPQQALRLKDQVIRLTDRDGRGREPIVIVDDLPTNHYHAGGGIAFGPDGMLYVSVGDALTPGLAARAAVPVGKILRFAPDGSIPADNPQAGSPVWARGLRNTQAFTWLADRTLLGVEHGPSGMSQERGRAGEDELNVIRAGADLGWPGTTGATAVEGVTAPIWVWRAPIAPGGIAVLLERADPAESEVMVAGLRGQLERVILARDGADWSVRARETVVDGDLGRIRSLLPDQAGGVYLTTSNRDARGTARPGDDLVLRLRPRGTGPAAPLLR